MDHMLAHKKCTAIYLFSPLALAAFGTAIKELQEKKISPLLPFKVSLPSPNHCSNRLSCLATCSFSLLSVSVSSLHSTEQAGKYAVVGEHLCHRLLVLQVRVQILRAAGAILPFPVLGNPMFSCLCSLDRTLPQNAKIPYKTNTFYSSKRMQTTPWHKNVHVSSRGLLLF